MSRLFSPVTLGGVALKNRVMISPMCQYKAEGGVAGHHHLAQYGRFALGGAGLVMVEVTSVSPEGMGTHGDLGLWNDAQEAALAEVARCISVSGAVPAIQIGHAGRKGASQRPWHGGGALGPVDAEERGEQPWPLVAPSAVPMPGGRAMPQELTLQGIEAVREAFISAAKRAFRAGFKVVEVHSAHGYLLNQFVSPLSNLRADNYGGSLENRCRLSCEILRGIKAIAPEGSAVFVRISASDGAEGGHELSESLRFGVLLKAAGADVIDCSSGGLTGQASASRLALSRGYQVPYAEALRKETGLPTVAVGLILDGPQAEEILAKDQADLIAIGRGALEDPNWAHHAREALEGRSFEAWPEETGWWLAKREALLARIRAAEEEAI